MRRLVQLALLLVAAGGFVLAQGGEVVDRIVVTVNGVPILQSDVEVAARYEALLDGRAPAVNLTGEQATLDRLIDQELLRQQMGKLYPVPAPAEVADRIGKIRAELAGTGSDEGWRNTLTRYGVTEGEVAERVAVQMQITRFLEHRLRTNIRVDAASVQAYYRDNLLPELKKAGVQAEPPLAQVRSQIEEILTQQRMDQELAQWLQSLRQQSTIRTAPDAIPLQPKDAHGEWKVEGK